MNTSVLMIFLSFGLTTLQAFPWDLDLETRNLLNSHINAIHQKRNNEAISLGKTDYMIDYERKRINLNSRDCPYCQHSEQLKHFHFEKRWPDQPKAHCFGSTLFLIQYLLAHPQSMTHSCTEILSEIQNESNFEEMVHSFSMNQHSYYAFKNSHDPLELNPELMKDYFLALTGTKPSAYHVLPLPAVNATFDKTTIYATLKRLPNQLIMIGYTDKEGYNHCIAVSTQPQKLFVFDSNLGIYQFPDLETLSWSSEKVLRDCRFRWLAAFSP
jgi:hypothetical protein